LGRLAQRRARLRRELAEVDQAIDEELGRLSHGEQRATQADLAAALGVRQQSISRRLLRQQRRLGHAAPARRRPRATAAPLPPAGQEARSRIDPDEIPF
jgi:hypothetical protein